jgi:hypothetical protein
MLSYETTFATIPPKIPFGRSCILFWQHQFKASVSNDFGSVAETISGADAASFLLSSKDLISAYCAIPITSLSLKIRLRLV